MEKAITSKELEVLFRIAQEMKKLWTCGDLEASYISRGDGYSVHHPHTR